MDERTLLYTAMTLAVLSMVLNGYTLRAVQHQGSRAATGGPAPGNWAPWGDPFDDYADIGDEIPDVGDGIPDDIVDDDLGSLFPGNEACLDTCREEEAGCIAPCDATRSSCGAQCDTQYASCNGQCDSGRSACTRPCGDGLSSCEERCFHEWEMGGG